MSSFSAVTLSVGSFDPLRPVTYTTYNVFVGTLNLILIMHTSENLEVNGYSTHVCGLTVLAGIYRNGD